MERQAGLSRQADGPQGVEQAVDLGRGPGEVRQVQHRAYGGPHLRLAAQQVGESGNGAGKAVHGGVRHVCAGGKGPFGIAGQSADKAKAGEGPQLPEDPGGRVDLQRVLHRLHARQRHTGQLVDKGGFGLGHALGEAGGNLLSRLCPPGFRQDFPGRLGHFRHLGFRVPLDQAHIFREFLPEGGQLTAGILLQLGHFALPGQPVLL